MKNPRPVDKNGVPFQVGDIIVFDERLGWGFAGVGLTNQGRLCTVDFFNGFGMLLDDEHAPFWIENYGIEIWAYCIDPPIKAITHNSGGQG